MTLNSSTVSIGDTATASQYNNARKDVVKLSGDIATSGGSANAYTLSIDSQFALVSGVVIKFIANFANTGAATINVNSGGAVSLKKHHDQALEANDIENGSIVMAIYDGTNWQILNTTATQMSSANSATLTGGSNADALHIHAENLKVMIPAAYAVAISGAALQLGSPGGAIPGITMKYRDSNTDTAIFSCQVPKGATGIASLKAIMVGGGTGNVVTNAKVEQVDTSGSISTDTTAPNLTSSVNFGALTVGTYGATSYDGITVSENALLNITITRQGSDGSDTLANDLFVAAIFVTFS